MRKKTVLFNWFLIAGERFKKVDNRLAVIYSGSFEMSDLKIANHRRTQIDEHLEKRLKTQQMGLKVWNKKNIK